MMNPRIPIAVALSTLLTAPPRVYSQLAGQNAAQNAAQSTSMTALPASPAVQISVPAMQPAFPATAAPTVPLNLPHSSNPLDAYRPAHVPAPNLTNSPLIDTLVHNGILELSLKDAIALALKDNLDLAIARYNIPIAKADVLRTQAGGTFLEAVRAN